MRASMARLRGLKKSSFENFMGDFKITGAVKRYLLLPSPTETWTISGHPLHTGSLRAIPRAVRGLAGRIITSMLRSSMMIPKFSYLCLRAS